MVGVEGADLEEVEEPPDVGKSRFIIVQTSSNSVL